MSCMPSLPWEGSRPRPEALEMRGASAKARVYRVYRVYAVVCSQPPPLLLMGTSLQMHNGKGHGFSIDHEGAIILCQGAAEATSPSACSV